jgi:hypothetical protein
VRAIDNTAVFLLISADSSKKAFGTGFTGTKKEQ